MTVSTDPNKKFRKELNSGIVSMVLLSIMTKAKEPMYGYQIAKNLEGKKEDVPMMKQGALYPVLRSLAAAGLLKSHVDPSITGPPRRYYQITDSGRQTLSSGITWKALIYMALQMPLGIFYFTLIITLITVSLSFIVAPILELIFHLPMEINGTDAYTHEWLLPFLPFIGTLLLLLTLHLAKLIGKLHGLFAKLMLVKK